jgi:hypothetical protein
MTVMIGSGFVSIPKTWPDFKSICNSKFMLMQLDEYADIYEIFAFDGPILYTATLYRGAVPQNIGIAQVDNDAWVSDFETNSKALCNRSVQPRAGDGVTYGHPVYSPTFLTTSEHARLKGYRLAAAAGTSTILDVEITNQSLIQGGQFWIRGAADGDEVSFSVVDKNNILGLHTLYGLPVGTPIELVKYVDSYHVPEGDYNDNIIMPTVAPVASGLFLRTTYTSVGVSDVRIGILYRWYEDVS